MNAPPENGMAQLLEELCTIDGARPSPVPGVTLLKATHSSIPVPVLYEPCIVIVARGRKRFHLPDRVVCYDAHNYFLLTVPVPADCETVVGLDGPFLGVAIRIDLAVLGELLMALGADRQPPRLSESEVRVTAPRLTPELRDAAMRLLGCLRNGADAAILGPQLVRELLYRVLCGEAGAALHQLLSGNRNRVQIHRMLQRMHVDYTAPLEVQELARNAGMSVSALHFHFKAVTDTSPVQYLKVIRLHKARMLMVQESLSASVAAARVGYESSSQFSREFKRMFGAPPADEAHRVRAAFGFTDEVSAAAR